MMFSSWVYPKHSAPRPPLWFRVLWLMKRQNRHWPPCEKRDKAMYRNWLDYCEKKLNGGEAHV